MDVGRLGVEEGGGWLEFGRETGHAENRGLLMDSRIGPIYNLDQSSSLRSKQLKLIRSHSRIASEFGSPFLWEKLEVVSEWLPIATAPTLAPSFPNANQLGVPPNTPLALPSSNPEPYQKNS